MKNENIEYRHKKMKTYRKGSLQFLFADLINPTLRSLGHACSSCPLTPKTPQNNLLEPSLGRDLFVSGSFCSPQKLFPRCFTVVFYSCSLRGLCIGLLWIVKT